MNLNDIPIFVKIVEHQGISKAATALGVPKSKVSRRLAQLEDDLGVRLIERNTRQLMLTQAGELLFSRGLKLVNEASDTLDVLSDLQKVPKGLLRISASISLGQYVLAPLIAQFQAVNPEVDIDLHLTNRRVDLIAEGYDMVFRVGELEDSNLICRKLKDTQGGLFIAPSLLGKHGSIETLNDLHHYPILCMSDHSDYRKWQLVGKDNKRHTVTVKPSLKVNDFSVIKRVCEEGGGIAFLPLNLVHGTESQNLLTQVLSDYCSPVFSYYLVYPSNKHLTRRAKRFIEFMMG